MNTRKCTKNGCDPAAKFRCPKCTDEKPASEFYFRANGHRIYRCKTCSRKRWLGERRTHKQQMQEFMNDLKRDVPCADCGHVYEPICMDFDHVRGTKSFTIGKRISQKGEPFSKLLTELRKCELVCSNCHRIRTHLLRDASWKPEEQFPTTTLIELEPPFVDDRGTIQNVLHKRMGGATLIHSVKGSVRAEHYHRQDSHYVHLLKGTMLYFERDLKSDALPKVTTVREGQLIFTPPLVEHAMYFTEDSLFVTLANRHRTPEDYESDLVRLSQKLTDIPMIRATFIDPPMTDAAPTAPATPAAPAQDMPGSVQ